MPAKEYTIWKDETIELPWYSWAVEKDRRTAVEWDESKTKINKATLRCYAKSDLAGTGLDCSMNNQLINKLTWSIGEAQKTKSFESDVTGILVNGENYFKLKYWKEWYQPKGGKLLVSLSLLLDYTGETPTAKPSWMKYLPYAVAVGSAGIATAVLVKRGVKK